MIMIIMITITITYAGKLNVVRAGTFMPHGYPHCALPPPDLQCRRAQRPLPLPGPARVSSGSAAASREATSGTSP